METTQTSSWAALKTLDLCGLDIMRSLSFLNFNIVLSRFPLGRLATGKRDQPIYIECHPLQDRLNRAEAKVYCAAIPPPQTLLWGLPEAIGVKMTSAFLA